MRERERERDGCHFAQNRFSFPFLNREQAAGHGHIHVVQQLLGLGCPIDLPTTADMQTPLHIAAGRGHAQCVRFLIERGASLAATGKSEFYIIFFS